MGIAAYVKRAVWDYLLVTLCGATLSYVVLNGFNVSTDLQYSPLPAVIAAVLALLLFVMGSRKKIIVVGSIAYIVVLAIGSVVAAMRSTASLGSDEGGNYLIFALVVELVPTVVYLLSRLRWGTLALLIAGVFVCGWNQFFYAENNLGCSLGFLVGAIALVIYRNYQTSILRAQSARSVSFSAGFGLAAAVVAAALGVSSLIWVAVIAPLDPGVIDVKLITEYRALETIQAHGTSSEYLTPNLDMTSSETNEESRTTDDLRISEDGIPTPARPRSSDDPAEQDENAGSYTGLDIDALREAFDFQSNPDNFGILVFAMLIIPLLVAAYFVGRRVLRARRLKAIRAKDSTEQVCTLYRWCTGKLGKVGFAVPAGQTLLEFAGSNREGMGRFDEAAGVSFCDLTRTYVNVVYGGAQASSEDSDKCAAYYQAFWKAARKQLGNVKYFFLSFRL